MRHVLFDDIPAGSLGPPAEQACNTGCRDLGEGTCGYEIAKDPDVLLDYRIPLRMGYYGHNAPVSHAVDKPDYRMGYELVGQFHGETDSCIVQGHEVLFSGFFQDLDAKTGLTTGQDCQVDMVFLQGVIEMITGGDYRIF